jgi:6-phosphogluconolactonase/glucosamine-6-phosphate isomerase/deaminase
LTLPSINAANRIMVLVSGANKAKVVSRVLGPQLKEDDFPIKLISTDTSTVSWYLDRDAASFLE